MKVFVARPDNRDDSRLIAVFTTSELAVQYVESLDNPNDWSVVARTVNASQQ